MKKNENWDYAYRITEVYAKLMQLAHNNNQVVGEKHDYYVTLEQLENVLMAMQKILYPPVDILDENIIKLL